jgi:hypothetical protein
VRRSVGGSFGPSDLGSVKTFDQLRGAGKLTKAGILGEWQAILDVNYWPIFDVARRIMEVVPPSHTKPLIEMLSATADKLLELMSECIFGCDVLPAAAHLTASMLAGAHPTTAFFDSGVMTLEYGKQGSKGNVSIALGSLDLLDQQRKMDGRGLTAMQSRADTA